MNQISEKMLAEQEQVFAHAFAAADLEIARKLYHPEVAYVSPTVRLYGWPTRIEGVDRTLQFIALTIQHCEAIGYSAVEHAIVPGAESAFVRIRFDWTRGGQRRRSNYVVIYRYRDDRIGQQELYYDPSGQLEVLETAGH